MRQVISIIMCLVLFLGNALSVFGISFASNDINFGICINSYHHNTTSRWILAQSNTQTPTAPVFSMADGYTAGRLAAEGRNTGGSFAGGLCCGLLSGLIGTGILWGATQGDDVPAHMVSLYQGKGQDYSVGFMNGYKESTKSKKRGARLGGGLLGTAALLVIALSGN